jgi:hypothetical protein
MRPWFPQHRFKAVIAGCALVSTICSASPQEGKAPRSQMSPSGGQAMLPAPSPRASQTADDRGSRPPGQYPGNQYPGNQHPGNQRPNDRIAPRVRQVRLYQGTRTIIPPAFVRCSTIPNVGYWHSRDIMAEIQWLSRRGFIPVSPIGESVDMLTDYAQQPAGWRAYGLSVPAGGTVQVEVQHPKLGWFRLMLVDKWGTPGPGMLQAAIAHQPVLVTYKNPGKEATAVYVVVDDPGWWSDAKNPYTLAVRRDWDPATTDLSHVKMVVGLWGASPSVSAQFRGPSLTGPAVYPR